MRKVYPTRTIEVLLVLGVILHQFDFQKCDAFVIANNKGRLPVSNGITSTRTKSKLQQASKRSGAISRKKSNKKKSNGVSGFGNTKESKEGAAKKQKEIPSGVIYSRPALYDLAFGYRNYEEEVDFLLRSHEKYSVGKDLDGGGRRIIELAAGPARHSITCLKNNPSSIASCTAVDISTDMVKYSKEIADEELGDGGYGGLRDRFQYIHADMRSLDITTGSSEPVQENGDDTISTENVELTSVSYDSAWILLGSMAHLTTNTDVISCFQSVYNVIRPGGTMVVELPHPRETFTMVECTRNGWEVPLEDEDGNEYGELKIIWGDDDDTFDPIRQIRDFTVAMDLVVDDNGDVDGASNSSSSDLQSVKEVVPMRLFTFQEIDALSRIAGFEVAGLYGALSDEVDVNSEDMAFRLVCVLRRGG